MRRLILLTCILSALTLTGCAPRLEGVNPDPADEFEFVKVEGRRMTGAIISIEGRRVGAAIVPALGDPLKRRDIYVPDVIPPLISPASVSVRAADAIGTSNTITFTVESKARPAPTFDILGVMGLAATGVDFIISGTGVFPGADTMVSRGFEGPEAKAIKVGGPGPASVDAEETWFLWEGAYLIKFAPNPAMSGSDYRIRIENHTFYGGLPGDSLTARTVP